MQPEDRHKLDRLLSGGEGLSVQEKERVLEHVLSQLPSPSRWRFLRWIAIPAVACAGLALWVAMPRTGEFVARGESNGSFRALCTTGAESERLEACHRGNTLVFDVRAPKGKPYFSAAALRSDGILIAYFPSETRQSLMMVDAGVASEGIVLGREHEAGRYKVYGMFSSAPLTRQQVREAIEADEGDAGTIMVQSLEVLVP